MLAAIVVLAIALGLAGFLAALREGSCGGCVLSLAYWVVLISCISTL